MSSRLNKKCLIFLNENEKVYETVDVRNDKFWQTHDVDFIATLKNGEIISVRGETKGSIATKPGLMGKLTYGPVFVPEKFGKVMNELTDEEMGETHREKALKELVFLQV